MSCFLEFVSRCIFVVFIFGIFVVQVSKGEKKMDAANIAGKQFLGP